MKQFIYLLCITALLCGCAQTKKPAPKDGRIAVQTRAATESVTKSTIKVSPDKPISVTQWQHVAGNAQNKIPHAQIGTEQKKIWQQNVGKGISSKYLSLATPLVVNGTVYTLDSQLVLTAVKVTDGEKLWSMPLPVSKELSVASIGLAFDNNALYAVSGDGNIYAIDAKGKKLWQKNTGAILRSAPIVANGQIYVSSGNNDLFALSTKDGATLWTYKSIETPTNLMGMGQAAVYKNTVIVPFSSGEIIAFDAKTGQVRWSDTLLSYRTFNQISDLSHVLAAPVIDGNIVYLIGNANRMGAFNAETGEPLFVQPIGGTTTPVISGNTLFMITNKNTLVALDKKKGALIFEKPLKAKKEKGVAWNAPILANNQLIITSTKGDVLFMNMETGTILKQMESDDLSVSPIVSGHSLILYTNEADLIAYQ